MLQRQHHTTNMRGSSPSSVPGWALSPNKERGTARKRSRLWLHTAIVGALFLVCAGSFAVFAFLRRDPSPHDAVVDGAVLVVAEATAIHPVHRTRRLRATERDEAFTLLAQRLLSSQTIFVNIATFRDVLCVETVREIFSAAAHPERIAVGIVDQRRAGDSVCIPPEYLRYVPLPSPATTTAPPFMDPVFPSTPNRFVSCFKKRFCPSDNVRIRYIEWSEARGPTYGRFVAGLMYQGESFYMMIDSHSRFEPSFDDYLLLDLMRTRATINGETEGGRGAVLSYYPPPFTRHDRPVEVNTHVMAMCKTHYILPQHVLKNGARWMPQPKRPVRQPYTGAGFVFGDATAQLDVPFDPYLDFVFDGEEILYTVRLYTAGYDAYMPGRASIFHNYDRHKAPRFISIPKLWTFTQRVTLRRVHYFLQTFDNQTNDLLVGAEEASRRRLDVREELYGLGTVRPIEKFYEFANIGRSSWVVDAGEGICDRMATTALRFRRQYPNMF